MEATLRTFLQFLAHFHAEEDVVTGVGEITCKILRHCSRVPVCMGDTQQKKTTYYVNFKVTQVQGYNIIFGYSLVSSMKVNIEVDVIELLTSLPLAAKVLA